MGHNSGDRNNGDFFINPQLSYHELYCFNLNYFGQKFEKNAKIKLRFPSARVEACRSSLFFPKFAKFRSS